MNVCLPLKEWNSRFAMPLLDKEITMERYPRLVNRGPLQDIQIELLEITTLFSSWDMFKRTATGSLAMFFQARLCS